MQLAILSAVALLAQGTATAPDRIDALQLPRDGIERTYACRSYLNAFSAMALARNPKDATGKLFRDLYLVLALRSEKEARDLGIAAEASASRATAWDAAVVAETLTPTHQDSVMANFKDCFTEVVATVRKAG
jgi:hypothetical protein